MGKWHAAGLGDVPNFVGVERQPLGIAERAVPRETKRPTWKAARDREAISSETSSGSLDEPENRGGPGSGMSRSRTLVPAAHAASTRTISSWDDGVSLQRAAD